jgi:dTDP-glucose pyrophosphorylase
MTRPELLVMAAGLGSRFGGLKQMEPIGPSGETVMDYSIFDAARAGVERAVFVVRREFERDFHRRVGAKFAKRMDVGYAFQDMDLLPPGFAPPLGRARPWGTGHAVLAAKGAVGGPFIVVNADDFYGRRAYAATADWLTRPDDPGGPESYALVAFRMANTLSPHGPVSRGVCEVGADGTLVSVAEYTGLSAAAGGGARGGVGGVRGSGPDGGPAAFTGAEPVSMNFWGFRPSVFGLLEGLFAKFLEARGLQANAEFYLPDAVDAMIRQGATKVSVLETPDRWLGLTHREDRDGVASRVNGLTAAGEYPDPLWGDA